MGKEFDSEMGILKNDRNIIFPITDRILIYNIWAASLRLVDRPQASLCINIGVVFQEAFIATGPILICIHIHVYMYTHTCVYVYQYAALN